MIVKKAGTILINLKNKKIGLIYREDKDDYSFPKGHLENDETLQECAVRETEEETGRKNHLINKDEICIVRYINPLGEDVECYYYLAVDDGESKKEIPAELKENLVWIEPNDVKEIISYDNLKEVWEKVKIEVNDILSNITPAIIKFDINKKQSVAYDNETKIGECNFIELEGFWNIVHTEVNSSYQGQGIARKLVESVIENASIYNKKIVADCSYAKRLIDKKGGNK